MAFAGAAAAGGPLAAAAKIPGKVDLGPPLSALWGWGFALVPGQRYRKILTRAVVADQQYLQIENPLGTVWAPRSLTQRQGRV